MAKNIAILVSLIFFVFSVNSYIPENKTEDPSLEIIRAEDAEEGVDFQHLQGIEENIDKKSENTKDDFPIYPLEEKDDPQCPDPTPVRGTMKIIHGHPFSYGCNVLLTCDPGLVFEDGKSVWNLTCLGLSVVPPRCIWVPVHDGRPICKEPGASKERMKSDQTEPEDKEVLGGEVKDEVVSADNNSDDSTTDTEEETEKTEGEILYDQIVKNHNFDYSLDIPYNEETDLFEPEEDLDGTFHENNIEATDNNGNYEITLPSDLEVHEELTNSISDSFSQNGSTENSFNEELENTLNKNQVYGEQNERETGGIDSEYEHFTSKGETLDKEKDIKGVQHEMEYEDVKTSAQEKIFEKSDNENILEEEENTAEEQGESFANQENEEEEIENEEDIENNEQHEKEEMMNGNIEEEMETDTNSKHIKEETEEDTSTEITKGEEFKEDTEPETASEITHSEAIDEETEAETDNDRTKSENTEEGTESETETDISQNEFIEEEPEAETDTDNIVKENYFEEEEEYETVEDEAENVDEEEEENVDEEQFNDENETGVPENHNGNFEKDEDEEHNNQEMVLDEIHPLQPPAIKEPNIIYAAIRESKFGKEEDEEESENTNADNLMFEDVEPPGYLLDIQMEPVEESKEEIRTNENACSLPAETGPCRAYFRRFFFNTKTKECDVFIYGGCSGNGNNFKTLNECENACGRKNITL